MTDNLSWFAEPAATRSAADPASREQSWESRFRGAVLGGAVGDALGAGVRHRSASEIQHRFGPQGVLDYIPVFGRRGAATEVTQLSVFTLEALLRAKAMGEVAPTPAIRSNQLSWLYTQGVPWEFAMSGYSRSHPEPTGWLLEHPELFSTRNPAGSALRGLGVLATQPPPSPANPFQDSPPLHTVSTECVAWTAPVMLWSADENVVCGVGYHVANLLTDDYQTRAATALHADVLAQSLRGVQLWDAVRSWEVNRSYLEYGTAPDAVLRTVYAAMLSSGGGRRAQPAALDIEFDREQGPGDLGVALAAVAATGTFADALSMAVNHSGDSSVAGALAGQLAGAIYGVDAIPRHWSDELELRELLETLCADATEAFAPPPPAPPPEWAKRYVSDARTFSGPLELPRSMWSNENTVEGTAVAEPYTVVAERVEHDEAAFPAPEYGWSGVGERGRTADAKVLPTAGFVEQNPIPAEWPDFALNSSTKDWMEEYFADRSSETDSGDDREAAGEPAVAGDSEDAEPTPESPTGLAMSGAPSGPVEQEAPAGTVAPEVAEPAGSFSSAESVEPIESPVKEPAEFGPVEADPTATEQMSEQPLGQADQGTAETFSIKPALSRGHAKVEEPSVVVPSLTERVLGCFLGGGLGNALGSDLVFATAEEIAERYGPEGPTGLGEAHGLSGAISEDTQMTLFTAEGLVRGSVAYRRFGIADPLPEVQLAYQRWLHTRGVDWTSAAGAFHAKYPTPDGWLIEVPGLFGGGAPSETVYQALSRFGQGYPAGSFTEKVNDSKGSGGVMRAAPVALYSSDPAVVFELAAEFAALTHSHPSGYLSAGALAVIVQQALLGQGLDDGVWLALQVLETWEDYEETSALLKAAVELAGRGEPTSQEIAENLGGGWVGEQALAIAVCAALAGGDDVRLALRVAVRHSGDSDSTGSICGNIMGALAGIGRLPVDWLAELSLRDVIEQMALDCVAEFGVGEFFPETQQDGKNGRPADEDWQERYPVRPLWSNNGEDGPHDPRTRVLPIATTPGAGHQQVSGEAPEAGHADEPVGAVPEAQPQHHSADHDQGDDSRDMRKGEEHHDEERPPSFAGEDQVRTERTETEFLTRDTHAPKPAPRHINGALANQHDG